MIEKFTISANRDFMAACDRPRAKGTMYELCPLRQMGSGTLSKPQKKDDL